MAKATFPKNVNKAVALRIAQADTVEKVWALVAELAEDGNQYTPETYLANVRAYARIALEG